MASGPKKSWSDLSTPQRTAIIAGGVVEVVLTAVAVRDLVHRSPDQVRGPKLFWLASFVVQPLGPIGYLGLGRIRGD